MAEEDGCSQCVKPPKLEPMVAAEIEEDDDKKDLEDLGRSVYEVGYDYEIVEMPNENCIEEDGDVIETESNRDLVEEDLYGEEEEPQETVDSNSVKNPKHVVEVEIVNTQTNEKERAYKCELCNKSFRSSHQVRYHIYCDPNVEKPLKCSECGVKFKTGYQLKQHMQLHSDTYFECAECGKRFAHDASAKKHFKKHVPAAQLRSEKPERLPRIPNTGEYTCTICDKVFARKDYLKKHMICHTEEKRYKCGLCDKSYMRFNALKFHVQSTHEKTEDYICNNCHRAFSSLQSLQRHLQTHSASFRLQCKICGLKSTRRDNLLRHIRSFHPNENPKDIISTLQEVPEEEVFENW